jgi:protein kinase A
MQQLHHPFLTNLVQTYQDKQFIFMLLGLVQGGELFSLLHQTSYDGISEKDTKFYASGILEALSHMHRRHIIYRDLKPEKYVFTLCVRVRTRTCARVCDDDSCV